MSTQYYKHIHRSPDQTIYRITVCTLQKWCFPFFFFIPYIKVAPSLSLTNTFASLVDFQIARQNKITSQCHGLDPVLKKPKPILLLVSLSLSLPHYIMLSQVTLIHRIIVPFVPGDMHTKFINEEKPWHCTYYKISSILINWHINLYLINYSELK